VVADFEASGGKLGDGCYGGLWSCFCLSWFKEL